MVYLPNNAKGDPNLVAGDVIAFALAANGTPVCVSSYMDDPIGTVKMFTGTSDQVRPGWACMGGGNESKHLNGHSWNMEDKFARHSCSDGKVGTTGGNETHDHGGMTGAAGTHNHGGYSTDAMTEIRVYDPNSGVGPAQSQHRSHNHEVTLQGESAERPFSSSVTVASAYTTCTSTERDGVIGGCGYDTTLSHAVDDPAHHHEISNDGDHYHTIPTDTHLPPYRYLRFIERIDNSDG